MTETDLVYGVHAVMSALRSHRPGVLYVKEGVRSSRVEALVNERQASQILEVAESSMLERLAGTRDHQGVVFQFLESSFKRTSFDALLVPKEARRLILALDGVSDPGNLGACLRSAATFGVDAVLVPKHGSAPMNATVHKRSAGAAAKTPVLSVTNLARSLRQLKEVGYWVIGTAISEQAKALDRVSLSGDLVLVMGSEGDGMRVNVQKQCDETVLIPMPDPSFTLNVSVATGICLYEIERQRRQDR